MTRSWKGCYSRCWARQAANLRHSVARPARGPDGHASGEGEGQDHHHKDFTPPDLVAQPAEDYPAWYRRQLFLERQLFGRLSVHGRAVAGEAANQRLWSRLWLLEHRQVHRPGRLGGHRRRLQLRRAAGDAGRARTGFQLLCRLVSARRCRLSLPRHRNQIQLCAQALRQRMGTGVAKT